MDRANWTVDLAPVILAAGVICWVAGFDLIYATQDYDFDRREGIRSLVVKLGIARSLSLAQLLHICHVCRADRFRFRREARADLLSARCRSWRRRSFTNTEASKLDLAGINRAFFQSNAFVSAIFLIAVCLIG